MKKAVFLFVSLCLVATVACAQAPTPATPTAETKVTAPAPVESQTLKGDIIDNMCAGSQKPEELAAFVKTHTKECALMPNCVESGYSIFSDGQLSQFDKESNAKIAEFLQKAESKLQVLVTVNKTQDGKLHLASIANQE